ncbi:MAG: PilN domain-containing protein [Candidatus Paceibacterota bacterium]
MLNLLPTEQKKKITQEYRLKVLWLSLFVLSCLFVFALIGILPSYLNEKIKVNAITQEKVLREQEQNNPVNVALIKKAETNRSLAVFLDGQIGKIGSSTASLAIKEVLNKKTNAIKINSFSFKEKILIISGVASNRTELTSFLQSLKDDSYFKSASLPLSDIVKSIDNNFTIELILK